MNRPSAVRWAAVAALPLAALLVLVLRSNLDARWEHHPAHFWLVLGAGLVSLALAVTVSEAGRRRRDARLFLVSLAFMASAGFLGLHALATPGVLLGKNAGFELATPVGLLAAGAFAAASAVEWSPRAAALVVGRARVLRAALLLVLAAWGGLSLAEVAPLDDPLQAEQLEGWQRALAGAGVALYAFAALGYYRLYRRRRAWFVFAVTAAFALLAEAMIAIAAAVNWHASWWEWHLLMLLAFAFVGYSARREWHEERFSAIYLDETLEGARDVSLLFADLQGFTPFAERTPPAAVTDMLNGYFGRLVPLLRDEFGAEVHQIVGDEVMAIWNKEGDLPDHAERAARAGLAFQRVAGQISGDHPDWPRFRVAVNSGEVVAGVVGAQRGHRKHGVVGDTVNLAARLQTQAEAGQVVIGEGTYERLPKGAVAERLPELHVKGKEEPVEAFVLRAL